MIGAETTRVRSIWPAGVADGPCRIVDVEGMGDVLGGEAPNEVTQEALCGRTIATKVAGARVHRVIWTCVACAPTEPGGRPIAIHELVVSKQSVVPTWEIYAELGG